MSTKKKIEGFQEKINLTYQEKAVRFKKASIRVNLPNFQHGFSWRVMVFRGIIAFKEEEDAIFYEIIVVISGDKESFIDKS